MRIESIKQMKLQDQKKYLNNVNYLNRKDCDDETKFAWSPNSSKCNDVLCNENYHHVPKSSELAVDQILVKYVNLETRKIFFK